MARWIPQDGALPWREEDSIVDKTWLVMTTLEVDEAVALQVVPLIEAKKQSYVFTKEMELEYHKIVLMNTRHRDLLNKILDKS